MAYLDHLFKALTVGITLFPGALVAAAATPSLLPKRQASLGFTLVSDGMFEGLGLTPTCEQVLYQQINCEPYVLSLGQKKYHGSLGDETLTDAVCADTCSLALSTARRRIAGACSSTPEALPGFPVLDLIDSVIAGWEETCLKDSETGEYCNDIIEAWEPVEDIGEMPEENLCSECYGAKLSLMQQSPYSVYGETHAEILAYINEHCGETHPTEPQPSPSPAPGSEPPEMECATGQTYKAQEGDTCDSIALAHSVSAATLYYINPALLDCNNATAGQELCLPLACEVTYTVQEGESCVEIGVGQGTTWNKITAWNAMLDSRCSNIWSTDPFWGRVICVSAPGGATEGIGGGGEGEDNPGNGNIGGPGGSGDGYADYVVDPPVGGTVADGTTPRCGHYIQAEEGVSCSIMIARNAVTMDLFLRANPSLESTAACTSNLVVGTWYCLHPTRAFDSTSLL